MVDIVQIKKRTNKDAIEMLKEAIVEIEAGRVVDVAIAFVKCDGSIGFVASEGEKGILLGAALSMAERSFHKLIDES